MKRELWLRTGASGREEVQPYAQQNMKKIGEVRCIGFGLNLIH